jgi:osmotically-inducible protein OsmY
MRRIVLIVCQFVFGAILIAPAIAERVKTDAEIRQCISERFSNSPGIKDQGFSAAVTNGTATLSGTAKNPGSKGAATQIAKKCGAATISNNITISPDYKPVKPAKKEM